MSDFTALPLHSETSDLAAANRRLTTAILGMTLLIGLVACMSYLAGRTVTHIRAQSQQAQTPQPPTAPVVVQPLPKPAPLPAAPPAPAGSLYLQVGLLNPELDQSMRVRLEQRGYTVRLLPMEDSPNARVLVGPVASSEHQRELEARLRADGYQYFLRRL